MPPNDLTPLLGVLSALRFQGAECRFDAERLEAFDHLGTDSAIGGGSSEKLEARRLTLYADASERRHWNTCPSLHMACSTTASLRANATRASRMPMRWARRTAQSLSRHHSAASPQHAAGCNIQQPPDLAIPLLLIHPW
jgi:hypothetical protein